MNFIDNTKLPILIPSKLINREHKELNDTLKSFIGINPDLSIFSVNLYLDALDELDFEINDYVLNLINQ